MIKVLLITTLFVNLYFAFTIAHIIIPVDSSNRHNKVITKLQNKFNIDRNIAEGIYTASRTNNLDPFKFARLIKSESNFKKHVVSSAGYKGIAQTPTYTGKVKTDLMHGAEILREKLRITDGDLHKAIVLYKGFDLTSKRGNTIARKVLKED